VTLVGDRVNGPADRHLPVVLLPAVLLPAVPVQADRDVIHRDRRDVPKATVMIAARTREIRRVHHGTVTLAEGRTVVGPKVVEMMPDGETVRAKAVLRGPAPKVDRRSHRDVLMSAVVLAAVVPAAMAGPELIAEARAAAGRTLVVVASADLVVAQDRVVQADDQAAAKAVAVARVDVRGDLART
jgi:hypothetical protein